MKIFKFYYFTQAGQTAVATVEASNHGIAKAQFKKQPPADFEKILKIIKEKQNDKI